MKPIQYNRRQVALMVKVAAFFSVSFAAEVGEASARILQMASGELAPTPPILHRFDLKAEGSGYTWNPR